MAVVRRSVRSRDFLPGREVIFDPESRVQTTADRQEADLRFHLVTRRMPTPTGPRVSSGTSDRFKDGAKYTPDPRSSSRESDVFILPPTTRRPAGTNAMLSMGSSQPTSRHSRRAAALYLSAHGGATRPCSELQRSVSSTPPRVHQSLPGARSVMAWHRVYKLRPALHRPASRPQCSSAGRTRDRHCARSSVLRSIEYSCSGGSKTELDSTRHHLSGMGFPWTCSRCCSPSRAPRADLAVARRGVQDDGTDRTSRADLSAAERPYSRPASGAVAAGQRAGSTQRQRVPSHRDTSDRARPL